MRIIREVAHNIPNGYGVTEDRLFGCNHMEWVLYVCDHYWVLDISNHLEFYYNPEHGIGKIHKEQLPPIVFERLKNQCVVFNSQGERFWHGKLIKEEEPNIRRKFSSLILLVLPAAQINFQPKLVDSCKAKARNPRKNCGLFLVGCGKIVLEKNFIEEVRA